jgi:hypothetical protein
MPSILDTTNLTTIRSVLGVTNPPTDQELIGFINTLSTFLIELGLSPFLTGLEDITEVLETADYCLETSYPIYSIQSVKRWKNAVLGSEEFDSNSQWTRYGTKVWFNCQTSDCGNYFVNDCGEVFELASSCYNTMSYQIQYKTGYNSSQDIYLNNIVKLIYQRYKLTGLVQPTVSCHTNIKSKQIDDVKLEYFSNDSAWDIQRNVLQKLVGQFLKPLLPKPTSNFVIC